ncbi:MAG: class II aldolase/adducin family protein [Alphaproteobacteria bacterium]|nr:class II aldolase/adducin family protein [Alphaproteobacteria bacterium]
MIDLGNRTSIYQPEQPNLQFPSEPEFNDVKATREDRKRRLVAACHAFATHGFDYGFAGHLTIRDPEHPELYWTNPMAIHFEQVSLRNLILVNHDGKVVEGDYAVNRAGFVLHAAVHEAHPDILAMCHAHTIYGGAYASLGRSLPPISQDACAFFEDHTVIKDDAGHVAVEEDAGTRVAKAFTGVKAAIHQNHGLLTASRHSIDSAAFWFIALERCCQQQLMIDATGIEPKLVDEESARYSREHVGSEYIGWLHFQALYEQAMSKNPSLFQ